MIDEATTIDCGMGKEHKSTVVGEDLKMESNSMPFLSTPQNKSKDKLPIDQYHLYML